ncbi:MAG TPA: putative quinol monooxygenase [Pseudonocardiaceae bacterium]|nr:putative quinol monooxygenase [Pseudonocardiaceae bacterium]
MIFIVVKWAIRPECSDQWLTLVDEFTRGTRAEPGNLFFEWSRSVEDPNVFVLVEAFADAAAGAAHVQSGHFKAAMTVLPDAVASTPEIINVEIPGAAGWSQMAEVTPRGRPGDG